VVSCIGAIVQLLHLEDAAVNCSDVMLHLLHLEDV